MKLSKRLATIAALVPPGSRLADIGTDHAYLPVYLVSEGIVPSAVAGEVNQGPFRAAGEALARVGLTDRIDLRFGDGLAVLAPGEVDTAVIAGMGGPTIVEILDARPEVTASLSCLVLQPMLGGGVVRRWLASAGWHIVAEALVEEDGRLYEVIAAAPGAAEEYEEILLDIGPLLWARRHPLLGTHVAALLAQARRVAAEMAVSPQAVSSPKYREYLAKITQLEDRYACL
ncbi:MAG: class I SAM-dependent methyltransferase [Sporomusaceae bacterium]|nr:class I SAM-dependent methyltransferase [Sporomusaceae bacterium]